MYKRNQRNSMKNMRNTLGRVRNCYPTEDGSWGSLEDELGQRFPLLLVSFCKNQQAKACWKCCKRHTNVKETFCFCTENFYIKISKLKIKLLIYLRVLES
jgi:hypothetical protein